MLRSISRGLGYQAPMFARAMTSRASSAGTSSRWSDRLVGMLVAGAATAVTVSAAGKDAPQPTVVTGTHPVGGFTTIRIKADASGAVARQAANLPAIVNEVLKNAGIEGDDLVVGGLPVAMAGVAFSTQLWAQLCKKNGYAAPRELSHFEARKGAHGDIPATGGDILLHVKAPHKTLCYEITDAFVKNLPAGAVVSVEDHYGFQYRDGRDLSGFLDGTMNAAGMEERSQAALRSGGAGAFVIHQKWIHNIDAWRKRSTREQEAVVGREKPFSTELAPPPTASHVARCRDKSGQRILIVRQSMPYGTVGGEHGLLFIAYSSSPAKFDTMLDRMTGNDKTDATHGKVNDDIMGMSKCVASQYYYCPSQNELSALANAQ